MIIIEMSGGLGNQMFQYALYKSMLHKGLDVTIDKSIYRDVDHKEQVDLDRFPNVSYIEADRKLSSALRGYGYNDNIIDKIRNKLNKSKRNLYHEDLDKGYQPEIFEFDNVYLNGYWQCERYFKDIRNEIKKDFIFPCAQSGDDKIKALTIEMESCNSVSLHVRRGDYLKPGLIEIYGDICTEDYYKKAIEYIKERVDNPVFYIFSNDMAWVRDNFKSDDFRYVNEYGVFDGMTDMYLMTWCRHNIVANSSFSWWGAWLNKHDDNIVICPNRWVNTHTVTDIICEDWIRIDV